MFSLFSVEHSTKEGLWLKISDWIGIYKESRDGTEMEVLTSKHMLV